MFPQKSKALYLASEWQYNAAGGEVPSILDCSSRVTQGGTRRLLDELVK